MEKAMSATQLADTFCISYMQVTRLCKMKGSPAYKTGPGKTATWICMPSKFEKFMLDMSERWKG